MRINIEHDGQFIPDMIRDRAFEIISNCLNSIRTSPAGFIVNDTLHFRRQRNSNVTACVMNSANFISSQFQRNLSQIPGCRGETNIAGQDIDGMIVQQYTGIGYRVKDKNKLLEVLHDYIVQKNLPESAIYTLFPMFYGMYVQNAFYDISHLPPEAIELFESVPVDALFRLGVEFETGNVASSFRALNKLFVLFQEGHIDAGVFVTSTDKSTSATRIWPVSNRNGSFQELRQRNYLGQVSLPLLCVGFAPDGFDSQAQFLGRGGLLYSLRPTGTKDNTGCFDVFIGEDGEEILRPAGIF
ncbi:hypothetical protein [Pseudomonas sp. BGI-2]|uniref:hypothetical protein n=1 Tax=Pseudomonas sp. BGI-2 TaxID=2528211 RepID=UPI001034E8FC|nr:hypothetical protein [Pseudomonas sp. BGI-2]TBN32180.1 hypothetical protein EYC95_29140 [Pseudomonas sp. BGI-2]